MLTLTMESAIVLCLFVPFPRTLRDAEGPVRMVPNPTTHTSTVSSALSLDIRLWPDAWLGVGWFLFSQRWRDSTTNVEEVVLGRTSPPPARQMLECSGFRGGVTISIRMLCSTGLECRGSGMRTG
jgi:hypothetical protein